MKLAICDDEKQIRDIIAETVRTVSDSIEIEFYSNAGGVMSDDFDADILLLDIQMPGTDGMTAARQLRKNGKKTVIVFVTAVEEQVYNAFDVGAFNFIVKPFKNNRLQEVLTGAVEQAKKQKYIDKTLSENEAEKNTIQSITVKTGGKTQRVILSEIAYAEVFDRRIVLHMADKDGTLISYYGKISDLARIIGKNFFRVHRAYIINLAYVRSYDSKLVRIGDFDVPVARGKYQELVKAYLSYHTRREGL